MFLAQHIIISTFLPRTGPHCFVYLALFQGSTASGPTIGVWGCWVCLEVCVSPWFALEHTACVLWNSNMSDGIDNSRSDVGMALTTGHPQPS